MPVTFTVNAAALVAINKYATSTEETRYYLNGVCLEVQNGKGFMVATDGHRLLAAPFKAEGQEDGRYIVPRALLLRLKITRRSEETAAISIDGERVSISFDGTTFAGDLVDGTFPDWRRAIPSEVSGDAAHFNNAYLKDADDAGKLLGFKGATVAQNGNNPAWLVYPTDDLFGCIMPLRAHAEISRPSWLRA